MKKQNCSFFQNTSCGYFPCHKGADAESFNCLFCYCPLYAQGEECGGNFTYTENGIKDCSGCLVPHSEKGYDYVLSKISASCEKLKMQGENNEKDG